VIYDCIIIGAGPSGLQAGIYLGRYNRNVLLLDRGGGRTMHARHVENFITQKLISGKEIIDLGIEQVQHFGVRVMQETAKKVSKAKFFEVQTEKNRFSSKCVIVSSGVYDNLPPIENVHKYFGTSFFTCVNCDGYRTTNKKLVVVGNSFEAVRLAFGMKEMYTRGITLMLYTDKVPEPYKEELENEGIQLVIGRPVKIIGGQEMEALEMKDGRTIACEVIMSNFGFKLNDSFLSGLQLERDSKGFKYRVNSHFESSMRGLYIVGPLNTGHDQIVIAAGEGAVAAIDINKRLLDQ
jgi:thioredoxin reductase (NADPH)